VVFIAAITVGRVGKHSADVIWRETREVMEDFLRRHAAGKVVRMSAAAIRVPNKQGLPLRTPGTI